MRLQELFENYLMEAPGDNSGVTVNMSTADLYDMMGKPYPTKPGPNGNPITPPGFFKKADRIVTTDIAQAHKEWVDGGRLPGLIKKDGNTVAYNENNTLQDLSWQFLAGGAELLASWVKGGSVVSDDVFNGIAPGGSLTSDGKPISNIKSSTISGYERGEEFWGDKVVAWIESKTDQSFKDNMAATSGAVETFNDARDLLMGGTGFNIEGAGGIMVGELPSEIIDLTLMMTTGPLAGMAASGALNALEAGGAAAQSIADRVNNAYDKGLLQETPQYKMYLDAAVMQLKEQNKGSPLSSAELAEQANDLARKQAIDMSISNAFYKVAVTGGVIDAIQNRILYRGPIKAGFMKNAIVKGVAGTTGEGVSGYLEQVFENLGIMDGAGNITYTTEGAFNAAYNEMLAAQSGNVLATSADAAIRAKGGLARFRQFVMGGRKDPKAILDIMSMDSNTLINSVETVDPETGVRKFAIAEMIKKRLVTSDQLTKTQKRKLARTGRVNIDGKNYTSKEIRENDDNVALVALLDDIEIDPKENTSIVNLNSEEEARRLAQLLGIEVDGKKVKDDTDINKVLARLEDVRKMDVRIEGRSTLEPPTWNDLNDRQKMQYWKEGKVEFIGDPERGNQTWTRKQVLFNSRRNGESIPEDIANLVDNTTKRPDINNEDYADMARELRSAQQRLDAYAQKAQRDLASEQKAWDRRYGDDPSSAPRPRPTTENNKKYQGLMRVANGLSGPGVTLKQQIEKIKQDVKDDADAWDAEYAETHTADGIAKADSALFNEAEMAKRRDEERKKQEKAARDNLDKVDDNDKKINKVPHVPELDSSNTEANNASREQFISSAKVRIANGDITAEELEQILTKGDSLYPGISDQIISKEAREKYKKINLQPEVKNEVVKDYKQPSTINQNSRPPEGTTVELDGQTYVWLGVEEGKGGMWAKVNKDGSRGTTAHKNHKPLMQKWIDNNLDKDAPKTTELVGEPNEEKRKQQVEKGNEWQTAIDEYSPESEKLTLVPPATEADARVKNMQVPDSVAQDFADVLATNNAIKIKKFLDGLPPAQAGKLRYDYNQGDFDVLPTKPKVTTTVQDLPKTGTQGQVTDPPIDLDALSKGDEPKTPASPQKLQDPPSSGVSPEVDAIISDPEGPNLLPKTKNITQPGANQPIRFIPQTKLTPNQKDAIAGRGEYAPGQVSPTDTPDAGIGVKDQDPNTPGIQTEPADTTAQDNQAQADDAMGTPSVDSTDTTDTKSATDVAKSNQDAADAAMGVGTAAIVAPAIKNKLNVTTNKNKNRKQQGKTDKTSVVRKGAPFFGSKDDEEDPSDLMKFYPAKYQDPLDLDKYKGAVKRQMGGQKK